MHYDPVSTYEDLVQAIGANEAYYPRLLQAMRWIPRGAFVGSDSMLYMILFIGPGRAHTCLLEG
jgi:protein-L-isoaspartate O-methyltransferase